MMEEKIVKSEILRASKIMGNGLFKRSYSHEEALEKVTKFFKDREKRTIVIRSIVGPDYLVIEEPKYEVRISDNGNRRIEILKKIKIKEIPLMPTKNGEKPAEELSKEREIDGKKMVLILEN